MCPHMLSLLYGNTCAASWKCLTTAIFFPTRQGFGQLMSPTSALARKIEDIRDKTGAKDSELAKMLDTSPQTLYRWKRSQVEPNFQHLRRILDLHYVAEELSGFYDQDHVRLWLFSRHKLLEGRSPADLMGGDEVDMVLALIAQLRDGAFT
jgi:transcriptional regulator with XRE-family HTH domain